MMNPMRRFVTGGSAFMSLTSRARRSISSTNTSMTEAAIVAALQVFDTRGNILVCRHQLAHADEGADNGNAHLHGAVACHSRTLVTGKFSSSLNCLSSTTSASLSPSPSFLPHCRLQWQSVQFSQLFENFLGRYARARVVDCRMK